jgi:hypothetical protein
MGEFRRPSPGASVVAERGPRSLARDRARPSLLDLQRTAGNRAVARLLASRQAPPRSVQRAIQPEDLTAEMQGAHFTVSEDITINGVALKANDEVEITAWDNALETASARQVPAAKPPVQFPVPKRLLRPVASGVAGIAPWSAGVGGVVKDFDRGQARIDAENKRKGGSRPDEVKRLADLQRKRLVLLNQRLIQGSFLNRFDADVAKWVDFYNKQFKYTGKDALDPNLVKAMLYKETQMGTHGEFLEVTTDVAPKRRTRQNILQNIDSSGEALLEMIPEEEPGIASKYDFPKIRKSIVDVPKTEDALWANPSFVAAVNEFFAKPAGGTARNEDYSFWIKSGVRWLFHKRQGRKVKSWEEAAEKYNGGGPDARNYKRLVSGWRDKAKKAESTGTEFVPDRL